MKVAILTDTHFGARNSSDVIHNYQEKFYRDVFFPTLKTEGIKEILHLGDCFDRRKFSNHKSIDIAKKIFFDVARDEEMNITMCVGNHDAYYKNTNRINTPKLMLGEYTNIKLVETVPEEVSFDGLKVLLVPWLAPDDFEESMKIIKKSNSSIAAGHLEITGAEMIKNIYCDAGYDKKIFDKFDVAYSGHFHNPHTIGNVEYIGSTGEMSWIDYNASRGFSILDTDTRERTFLPNPYRLFHKIVYEDATMTIQDIEDLDTAPLEGAYIKLIIKEKNNPEQSLHFRFIV
jgi:DNA repair exonuclease SbcCD nuclease subunit